MKKAKTFSQAIDILVDLYSKGMRVRTYEAIQRLDIETGICHAADNVLIIPSMRIDFHARLYRYQPLYAKGHLFWFETPRRVYAEVYYMDDPYIVRAIKDRAIKPRLDLLKQIQSDLKKHKKKCNQKRKK